MANGSTLAGLVVGDQKGRWAVLTIVLLGLSAGMSAVIVDQKIEAARQIQTTLRDQQISYLEARLSEFKTDMAVQQGRLWSEMSRRPDTEAIEGRRREVDRRLDAIERRLDNVSNLLFRGTTP